MDAESHANQRWSYERARCSTQRSVSAAVFEDNDYHRKIRDMTKIAPRGIRNQPLCRKVLRLYKCNEYPSVCQLFQSSASVSSLIAWYPASP